MAPQERRWEDRQTGCWFAARANLRFFLTKSCKEPWSPPRTAVQSPADRLDGRLGAYMCMNCDVVMREAEIS